MKRRERENLILMAVAADVERMRGLQLGYDRSPHLARQRRRIADANIGVARVDLASWLGAVPSNSNCIAFGRSIRHLESFSLVEAIRPWGGNITHLRLTDSGWQRVRELREASRATEA